MRAFFNQKEKKKLKLKHNGALSDKGKPVVLNGTFSWYNQDTILIFEDTYHNGLPLYYKFFTERKPDKTYYLEEMADFTRQCGGMPGSFYVTVYSAYSAKTRRVNKKGNIYVNLETTLAELQSDGTYKSLGTLSWGFTLSKTGIFRLKPLKLTSPSPYHEAKFNELNKK